MRKLKREMSKNHKEKKEPPLPPRKHVQKIIKEYLAKIDVDEYRKKLESLNEWQARDNRQAAQKIMEPLVVNQDEIEFTKSETLPETIPGLNGAINLLKQERRNLNV